MSRPKLNKPKIYPIQVRVDFDTKQAWDELPSKMRNTLLKQSVYRIIEKMNSHKYEWQDKLLNQ